MAHRFGPQEENVYLGGRSTPVYRQGWTSNCSEGRRGGVLRRVGGVAHELHGEIADELRQVAAVGGFAVDGLVEIGPLAVVALVEIVGAVEPGEAALVPVLADESQVVAFRVQLSRVTLRPLGGAT